MIQPPPDFAIPLQANYREFPGSSHTAEFPLIVDVLDMLPDGVRIPPEQISDLRLRQRTSVGWLTRYRRLASLGALISFRSA